MDESIETKQAYLRENILEKNYDADEFMSFLQMKKEENGLDLSNWAMKDLIKVVNEFIHEKNKESEPEEAINPNLNKINDIEDEGENNTDENSNKIKESTDSNIINEENNIQENDIQENNIQENNIQENNIQENNIQENNIQENNHIISQPKEEIIIFEKCLKPETSPLSNIKQIEVKLSSPKKIKEGIFSKSFISYVVTTDPLNYKTTKRYSDFSSLRNKLSMIYPNCVLPPLCKKNYGDRFTDALINKRMRSIAKFMQGITIHPVIKNCELLNLFLSVEKKNDYKKQIKKYEKIKKPQTEPKKMITIDGLINIDISKEKEIYLDNIKNYCQGNSYILQKITKAYKSLMVTMDQLSNKMKSISQLFKQLLDKSIKYYDSHNTSETFNIMSQFMSEWARIQQNQIKTTNENIREYFRYVKNEFNSLREMANKVAIYKTNYTKANDKLLSTKESLFLKLDTEAWQLKKEDKDIVQDLIKNKNLAFSKMLPNDTIKVRELKDYYGCMLNSLISEFERIRKVNARRHKENITNFIRELSTECTNMHICLADRLSEFNQLKDENDVHNIDGGIQLKKVENLNDVPNDENNNDIHDDNNINNNEFDLENNDNIDEEGISKNKKDKDKNIKEEKIGKKNDNIKEENQNEEEKKEEEKEEEEKKDEEKKEEIKLEEPKKEEEKKEEIKLEEPKKEEENIKKEEIKKEKDKKEKEEDKKEEEEKEKEEIKKEDDKKEANKIEENKKEENKKDENEIKDEGKEK